MPKRIAVVGSGCAGLGATWLLNEHSEHEVHLYEADNRPGGHANTQDFRASLAHKASVPVDAYVRTIHVLAPPLTRLDLTAASYIILNPVTYPNFLKFLEHKEVPVVPAAMSFSVSRDEGALEWAGSPDPTTLFCQPENLLNIDMWRMLWDLLRFNACALEVLQPDSLDGELSLGDYLKKYNYCQTFRDDYLLPVTAAIWTTPPDKISLNFPVRAVVQFMANHHLLQLLNKPSWLTIVGGSKQYVKKIVGRMQPQRVHFNTPVHSINTTKTPGSVQLTTADGETHIYDHVVMACHADTTLKILENGADVTEQERDILGRFTWNDNEAILHSDLALMPKRRKAWSCWNYLSSSAPEASGDVKASVGRVALTYCLNVVQYIDESKHGPCLLTLNPPFEPHPDKVVGRFNYSHPALDQASTEAQEMLPSIQNKRGLSFVGAWTKYGFHEDGFASGMRAAEAHLGARSPFPIQSAEREHKHDKTLAFFFQFFENSGARSIADFIFAFWLRIFAFVFLRR
ncbi:FAD/NAD(P)-binding domain-containing protein [Exidia glandulosa HHB12029]|uniref:FAD/NAD(P)-binding domain-containing protein n=1 Tax=Exidia glandulosa HHB12029 TaxID=1314781 RepID=A0A165N9Y1_EXIGL|nr:FAD/NAD(P)-binding domain-containing protein [Exidia glandulosa HHB12029]